MATTDAVKTPQDGGVSGFVRAVSAPARLAFGIGILAVLTSVATYAVVTRLVPYNPTPAGFVGILLINLALVAVLGGLVTWRLARLWAARRSGLAGAKLHFRLVTIFAIIAAVPAILVALFAAVTLNLGMEQWFSPRVQSAIANSISVAQSYVKDHEDSITQDAVAIANGIQHDSQLFDASNHVRPDELFTQLGLLTKDRGLQAAYIFDSKSHMLGSTKQRGLPDFAAPTASDIAQAQGGTIVIDANAKLGVVRALIRMQALNDAYLLVVRKVDPQVFAYYQRTTNAAQEYKHLNDNRSKVQAVFAALYGVVSLLILLAAIWLGLWAANRLVKPISQLIGAAERVSEGDLKAQVEVNREDDEIATLGFAFNRMTQQLQAQRSELIDASHQIDMRRRFTEAVLAGVSAGVIGLDGDGTITIVNRAAARLLNATHEEIEGRHYAEAVPELAGLIRRALVEPVGRASGEASIKRAGKARSLSVQVDSEKGAGEAGYIVTFDDITDLVSAQRTAAWADVARRIAHEIKNPLTPIQLSAERLKRKYAKEVTTDPEIFNQCVDTIVRQVGDIGRMVDEFSSFARMPQPVMRREIVQELVQQAVFLQRVGNPNIEFTTHMPPQPIYFEGDGRLISQALTNVIKNATEAVAAYADEHGGQGEIATSIEQANDKVVFAIQDNGVGLPHEQRHRLTEPYVTTRVKGTGLGLAIVRKIAEDHGGEITLADRDDGTHGAQVRLSFALKQKRDVSVQKKGIGDEQVRIVDRA
jgi:two-component system nitrogen regulation sensor histidine kinase NtrY